MGFPCLPLLSPVASPVVSRVSRGGPAGEGLGTSQRTPRWVARPGRKIIFPHTVPVGPPTPSVGVKNVFFPVGSFSVAMFGVGYPPIPPTHTHWTSLTGPCREASGPHIVGSLRSPHTHTGGLASYMPQRARRRWKRGSWNARKGFCRRWFVNSRWSAACRVMPDG
jgi:hypothetical protein